MDARPFQTDLAERIATLPWAGLQAELDAHGCARVPGLLDAGTCAAVAGLYEADALLLDAEVAPGTDLTPAIERLLERADVAYLHAHYAGMGCYAARIDQA